MQFSILNVHNFTTLVKKKVKQYITTFHILKENKLRVFRLKIKILTGWGLSHRQVKHPKYVVEKCEITLQEFCK